MCPQLYPMDDTCPGERPVQYTADLIDDVYSNYEEESDPSDGFESDPSDGFESDASSEPSPVTDAVDFLNELEESDISDEFESDDECSAHESTEVLLKKTTLKYQINYHYNFISGF